MVSRPGVGVVCGGVAAAHGGGVVVFMSQKLVPWTPVASDRHPDIEVDDGGAEVGWPIMCPLR